jgi:hypothetical protein
MTYATIRYTVKPDRIAENKALIEGVFAELHEKAPEGVRYATVMDAGGRFIHFVATTEERDGFVPSLEAFQRFRLGIEDRCIDEPDLAEVTVVGNYTMLVGEGATT